MAETAERARWRKVWTDLWSTPSHIALDSTALYVAVTCIVHASWERGEPEARLLAGAAPMPVDVLARICRLSVGRLRKALRQLEDAGTVAMVDGVITLPRFGRWQETADAARKRKARASSGTSPDASTDTRPDSPRARPGLREGEGEGEAEDEGEADPQAPAADAKADLRARAESVRTVRTVDHGLHHEIDLHRRGLETELQGKLPPWRGKGDEVPAGMAAALEDCDGDLVRLKAIVRHSAQRLLAGELKPQFWGLMWRGAGFRAHHEAWQTARVASSAAAGETTADDIRRVLRGGA